MTVSRGRQHDVVYAGCWFHRRYVLIVQIV